MDFFGLAIVHMVLTALYFLGNRRLKPRHYMIAETMIVFAIPFFGIILMLSYHVCCHIFRLDKGHQPDFEQERTAFFRGVQLDEDIIPLNDAFLVEDVQKKRHYFTDAIKQAVVDNENILQMAMHDRDREVAYYAVALLTARMEKLENELFARESKIISGENPENVPQLEEYAQLLKNYLEQKNFIDHVTYQKKQGDYIGLLDYLKRMCPEKIDYYTEEIRQLLDTENYAAAELVCAELQEKFPLREESYMMYIRLYQSWRKPKRLQAKIRELKASPLELSKQALRVIRFWDKEAVHG